MPVKTRKKLIEVALPLDAINVASAREKSIRHGHPSTLHLWWARRPLAAARAVIFAQMVDDPSSWPELFPTEKEQEKERKRLFEIIEEMVLWENTTNEEVMQRARDAIWESWRRSCAENADHPRAKELFDPEKLPAFHDPFAGGGSLPLEAQRLGLEAYASDLNPVAVLINKAMIEIPPKFAGKPPVNPESRKEKRLMEKEWRGAEGLAEDVRYYGQWMRDEAEKRIGHLYPKVEITSEMAKDRPDLKKYVGRKLTVIAWLWARTVKSPNPAFSEVDVPLISNYMLSTKKGKEAYVEPVIENGDYQFTVKVGKPKDMQIAKKGTSAGKRAGFLCLLSGVPLTYEYIRDKGLTGSIGERLMAIVAEGDRHRVYLAPTAEHEAKLLQAKPEWKPDVEFFKHALGFRVGNYGMTKWSDLFTPRQLVALTTFFDLVPEVHERAIRDMLETKGSREVREPETDNLEPTAYADALSVYLALSISRLAQYWSNLSSWHNSGEKLQGVFGRQAVSMIWDFSEGNPLSTSTGNFSGSIEWVKKCIAQFPCNRAGYAEVADAALQDISDNKVLSTDPPYYDNIGYADLSDFYYVWLRRAMKPIFPNLFATITVSKAEELVATPHRHGSRESAELFFLKGMSKAVQLLAEQTNPVFPVTIYYAYKQSESNVDNGPVSTGWETFLEAVIRAGFTVTGTWPIRTEMKSRVRDRGAFNALASSIILVCRKRTADALITTRREFVTALKTELPSVLATLKRGNTAPVDLAQAAIGPGMAIYTSYSQVLDADGRPLAVREALSLINQALDEVLAEQEGDFDADTRWALTWFEQQGFTEGEFGVADTLSKAKVTSVEGLVEAGFLHSGRGKVRLLRPDELDPAWDPSTDSRLTAWETVHHLIRRLEEGGEPAAAELLKQLGSQGGVSHDLCYRLYTICERKKWAQEALTYNSLVQSWPEMERLTRSVEGVKDVQDRLL